MEHTADAYVEATGRTLEEAFINAAKAMFEIMTDISKVQKVEKREVKDSGFDLESALYRWLEDLLIIHDSEGLVFSEFTFKFTKKNEDKIEFVGEAWGEKFDPGRHEIKSEVKAVTYSLMTIQNVNGCWVVRVVFDL